MEVIVSLDAGTPDTRHLFFSFLKMSNQINDMVLARKIYIVKEPNKTGAVVEPQPITLDSFKIAKINDTTS